MRSYDNYYYEVTIIIKLSEKYSREKITIKNSYYIDGKENAFGSLEEFQENFDLLTIIEIKER